MQLILNQKHWEIMRKHVESCAPLEACGLLAGKDESIKEVYLIKNQAGSPIRYRMDPIEQLHAFEIMETAGFDLLSIFHSHPAGPETPSMTDISEAAYQAVQIIWSRTENQGVDATLQSSGGWHARGFWIENGKAFNVTLQITQDE